MKPKLLIFLFVLLSGVSFGQAKANTDVQAIKKSFTYFTSSIKNKKTDEAVNCMYPKFFTIVQKDQMKQILEMTYNNPFMKVDLLNMQFGTVEKPELINGEYFSVFNYLFNLKCNVGAMNDEMKKKVSSVLESRYGKKNVKYLDNEGAYLINAYMKAGAISTDRKYWKFVILEKQYKPELVKILPQKILDKF
ncbi:hypothetical protein [Chryseobacterium populi]|uniref:Uncharacterized protein n=1 Tax=Chryseobacterium populi TaxID=1144316 RepID=J2K4W9_9FLAO|nr:hypothetical protein [Chryseobacterium populi]EJL68308.1 hypothetical protein PMI13_03751 [Chryseobacterium populi]